MRKWVLFSVLGVVIAVAAGWHFTRSSVPKDSDFIVVGSTPQELSAQKLRETRGEIVLGGGAPQEIPVATPVSQGETDKVTLNTQNSTQTKTDPAPVKDSSPVKAATSWEAKYKVQNGDTLGGIAKKKYGSASPTFVNAILKKNSLKNPNQLKIGMELILPEPASIPRSR